MESAKAPPRSDVEEERTAVLIRAISMLQSQSKDEWFYRSPSNSIQGPFPSEAMNEWLAEGRFNDETEVRLGSDGTWFRLKHMFPGEKNANAFDLSQNSTMPALRNVIGALLAEMK